MKKTKSQRSILRLNVEKNIRLWGVRTRSTTNLIQSPDFFFYFYVHCRKRITPRLSHVFNLSFFRFSSSFSRQHIFAVFDFMISFFSSSFDVTKKRPKIRTRWLEDFVDSFFTFFFCLMCQHGLKWYRRRRRASVNFSGSEWCVVFFFLLRGRVKEKMDKANICYLSKKKRYFLCLFNFIVYNFQTFFSPINTDLSKK